MRLARNTFYNLLGLGLPLVVAFFTIPRLLHELGVERFGLLTLIWAVVSYFSLFDLGLGRALTQQMSAAIARERTGELGPMIGTSLALMTGLGIGGGWLLWLIAPWGVSQLSAVSNSTESLRAAQTMALAIPFVVVTSGLRGILEAKFAFGLVNLIRIPLGLITFLGPLAVVLWWRNDLALVTAVLTAARVAGFLAYGWLAWRVLPETRASVGFDRNWLGPVLGTGGWMTVSNVISPLMGYIDRFVIATVLSVGVVAYYATPNEMITKIWIIPGALTAVLFPEFARLRASDSAQLQAIFRKATYGLFVLILPLTTVIGVFSRDLLTFWIDADFAQHSYRILQIFAVGILINCLAHIPYTLLQGSGQARTTAAIHVAELPIFVALLWSLTTQFGITGTAVAWLVRMIGDALLMFVFVARLLSPGAALPVRHKTA